jgi:hypothetical protein
MQMVKKIIAVLFTLWIAFLIFMPKIELYTTLEKELASYDIKLNEKSIEEGFTSLILNDVSVYVKGIKIAQIDEVNFFTLLFYSSFSINNVKIDEAFSSQLPSQAEEIILKNNILSVNTVSVDANGSFGVIKGSIDIFDRKIELIFTEQGEINMIRSYLLNSEKGWLYEASF